MNSNKSPLTKMLLMNFHEAALWSAITITRRFSDVSTREIIRAYKEELDISDENMPTSIGWAVYSRTNNKVNRARNELKEVKQAFKGELIDEVKMLRAQIDAILKVLHGREEED